jgi:hypothetical protein
MVSKLLAVRADNLRRSRTFSLISSAALTPSGLAIKYRQIPSMSARPAWIGSSMRPSTGSERLVSPPPAAPSRTAEPEPRISPESG